MMKYKALLTPFLLATSLPLLTFAASTGGRLPAASFSITAGPSASAITENSVKISWTLSAVGTGQIQYGTTTAYGKVSTLEPSFKYSSHVQTISGLTAGTLYHYRVVSKNAQGIQVVSADKTFTTVSIAPVITAGPSVSSITTSTAKISWTLSEPATGQIQYGTTTAYGKVSALESSFNYNSHIQTISGLAAGTLYHYRVVSKNARGVQVVSADKVFATLAGDYTYDWEEGSFGACSATACGTSGTQTRTVICKRNDGATSADTFCTKPKPATSQPCSAAACSTFSWIKGFNTTPPPNMSRPAVNVQYTDPVYKTKIARITSSSQVNDGTAPPYLRHIYSRSPAFNADGTKALMNGSGGLRLYSINKAANTAAYVKTLGLSSTIEPNWHPTDPNKFYHFAKNAKGFTIYEYNITTGQSATLRDLSSRVKSLFPAAQYMWTRWEGRPSFDGKIWCMMIAESTSSAGAGNVGIIAYNLSTDQILGSMPMTDTPDHISTSPKGTYCVPSWTSSKGTRAYKTNFSGYTQLFHRSTHSDLALSKDGKEMYVHVNYEANGNVVAMDMATGVGINLFSVYGSNSSSTALHISGVGTKHKPGYVTVSTHRCNEGRDPRGPCSNSQWFKNKVMIVELKASPVIYNVAHDRFAEAGYFSETQAVPNFDFTKILFTSTWGSTSESDISSYMVDVPAGSLP